MYFSQIGTTQFKQMMDNKRNRNEKQAVKAQTSRKKRTGKADLDMKMSKSKDSDVHSFCSVCRAKNQGLVAMCLRCGHGGHLEHIQKWFGNMNDCKNHKCAIPSCKCHCVFVEGN